MDREKPHTIPEPITLKFSENNPKLLSKNDILKEITNVYAKILTKTDELKSLDMERTVVETALHNLIAHNNKTQNEIEKYIKYNENKTLNVENGKNNSVETSSPPLPDVLKYLSNTCGKLSHYLSDNTQWLSSYVQELDSLQSRALSCISKVDVLLQLDDVVSSVKNAVNQDNLPLAAKLVSSTLNNLVNTAKNALMNDSVNKSIGILDVIDNRDYLMLLSLQKQIQQRLCNSISLIQEQLTAILNNPFLYSSNNSTSDSDLNPTNLFALLLQNSISLSHLGLLEEGATLYSYTVFQYLTYTLKSQNLYPQSTVGSSSIGELARQSSKITNIVSQAVESHLVHVQRQFGSVGVITFLSEMNMLLDSVLLPVLNSINSKIDRFHSSLSHSHQSHSTAHTHTHRNHSILGLSVGVSENKTGSPLPPVTRLFAEEKVDVVFDQQLKEVDTVCEEVVDVLNVVGVCYAMISARLKEEQEEYKLRVTLEYSLLRDIRLWQYFNLAIGRGVESHVSPSKEALAAHSIARDGKLGGQLESSEFDNSGSGSGSGSDHVESDSENSVLEIESDFNIFILSSPPIPPTNINTNTNTTSSFNISNIPTKSSIVRHTIALSLLTLLSPALFQHHQHSLHHSDQPPLELRNAVQNLVVQYISLEKTFINMSISKACMVNTLHGNYPWERNIVDSKKIEVADVLKTTKKTILDYRFAHHSYGTLTNDVLYSIKRSIQRAINTYTATCVVTLINHISDSSRTIIQYLGSEVSHYALICHQHAFSKELTQELGIAEANRSHYEFQNILTSLVNLRVLGDIDTANYGLQTTSTSVIDNASTLMSSSGSGGGAVYSREALVYMYKIIREVGIVSTMNSIEHFISQMTSFKHYVLTTVAQEFDGSDTDIWGMSLSIVSVSLSVLDDVQLSLSSLLKKCLKIITIAVTFRLKSFFEDLSKENFVITEEAYNADIDSYPAWGHSFVTKLLEEILSYHGCFLESLQNRFVTTLLNYSVRKISLAIDGGGNKTSAQSFSLLGAMKLDSNIRFVVNTLGNNSQINISVREKFIKLFQCLYILQLNNPDDIDVYANIVDDEELDDDDDTGFEKWKIDTEYAKYILSLRTDIHQ